MRKILIIPCALLFISLALANYAFGLDLMGPQEPAPYSVFSTLSAESPARGQAAASLSAEKSEEPNFYRFSTQILLGVTDNMSVGVNIPYVDNSHAGLEDIAVSFKHRFFDEGKYGPSVAYLVTASIQSSTEELSTDGRIGGGFIASKRVGPVTGHANVFYSLPADDALDDEIRVSTGVEFSAAHNFDILGEIFLRKSHFSEDIDELEARFGYRIQYAEGIYTTLGAGLGLDNRAPDFRIMASISLTFPRAKPIERVYEEGE